MDAARAYQRDSSAYVEQHFGAVIDDASQSSSGPANDSAVAATFTAPTMDLAKAANPSPIEQPIARIKFVPRPAHGLFPGISATYHNDLIPTAVRSEEHTSELQPLMRISYAVFCLKKKKTHTNYSKL